MKKYFVNKKILFILAIFFISISLLYSEKAEKKEGSAIRTELKSEKLNRESVAQDEAQNEKNNAVDDSDKSRGKSLFETVRHGGPLMIFIALLGIVSLTIIIERLIFFTRNGVWNGDKIKRDIIEIAKKSGSRFLEEMEDELRTGFQIYANGIERGMSLLSGIGNLSPIVGFLGTVIGMIDAFASIVAATTVNAKVVASGIQVALVTTAGGLIVAAPTLALFYLFSHIIQSRYATADEVINQVCEKLPRISQEVEKKEKSISTSSRSRIKAKTKKKK